MAATAPEQQRELACVVIPLGERQLLLPNECIAEILPWRRVRPYPSSPAWCLGSMNWRGEEVAVVRFDELNGTPDESATNHCVVVMNRSRSTGAPNFYGLIASGLPRVVQLTSDDLKSRRTNLGDAEMLAVSVVADTAVVPNLEFVENEIRAFLFG